MTKTPLCVNLFFLALPLLFGSAAFGAEPIDAQIDAEFTQTLLKMDEYSWDALGDEVIPLEQQRDSVLDMLNSIVRIVPASFLKNGVSPLPTSVSSLADDPAQFRGRAFELKGNVVLVNEITLNPVEKKFLRIPAVFRCRMIVDEKPADILTAFVPAAWKRNEAISERASATGIFIKRLSINKTDKTDLIPLLVAPRIQWFPDTFLGNLGFDVGSFDQVPPLRIADLKKKQFELIPSLQLLGRNEIIQRAFKFTEADREPFYGLLKAASQTPPGRIDQEVKQQEKKISVIELFNDPEGTRGKPVLLRGTAKRVLPTLVEDKEVKAIYGIEKYYQIYLYNEESQGNPLVVCVTSLPKGMPTGADTNYSEKISVAAIPYKLWVYETSAKLEGGSDKPNAYKPNYAPLLIGRTPIWQPKEKAVNPPLANDTAQDSRTTIMFTFFFLLLAVWIILRRFQSKRTIEFKLSKRIR